MKKVINPKYIIINTIASTFMIIAIMSFVYLIIFYTYKNHFNYNEDLLNNFTYIIIGNYRIPLAQIIGLIIPAIPLVIVALRKKIKLVNVFIALLFSGSLVILLKQFGYFIYTYYIVYPITLFTDSPSILIFCSALVYISISSFLFFSNIISKKYYKSKTVHNTMQMPPEN